MFGFISGQYIKYPQMLFFNEIIDIVFSLFSDSIIVLMILLIFQLWLVSSRPAREGPCHLPTDPWAFLPHLLPDDVWFRPRT